MDNNLELISTILQEVIKHQLEFTEKELMQIYTTLERATKFFLSKQDKPPLAAPPPDVPESGIPSSIINGYFYEPDKKKLIVQFHGKYPNAKGPQYIYDNVTPLLANILKRGAVPAITKGKNDFGKWWIGKNPSLGASVNRILVKGNHPYRKIA